MAGDPSRRQIRRLGLIGRGCRRPALLLAELKVVRRQRRRRAGRGGGGWSGGVSSLAWQLAVCLGLLQRRDMNCVTSER